MAGLTEARRASAKGYPDSYYAASACLPDPLPAARGDSTCDVCIIGGGYTGLSAALHLAQAGLDTVLLEARRIGWGASGRNGGQIHSGQRRGQDQLERDYGIGDARRLWQLGEDAKALLHMLIARHDIDCELKPGLIHGDHKARFVDHTRRMVDRLNTVYGYDKIAFLDRDAIRQRVATNDYHGGFADHGAGHLHPLKFALGLARAASGAGARLHEFSPVTRIVRADPALVETAQARIRARFVLLACNGHFDGLAGDVERRVMPINNFILATEPLGRARARALIRDDMAVSDSRFIINYYRLSGDGRLLFGGGETYMAGFPGDLKTFVRRPMVRVFPQLADTRIDFAWGGKVAVTMQRLPLFARLTPNVLVAAGYSGQGVTLATLGGQVLAEAIGGTLGRFDLLARLKTPPFPGGRLLRWPAMAAGMTWYGLRDLL